MLSKVLRYASYKLIGREKTRNFLIRLFKVFDFNMLEIAHFERGICKYFEVSGKGEPLFLKSFLPTIIPGERLVMFDVGANTGEYSNLLNEVFPSAKIYSFEPNPCSFLHLAAKSGQCKQINAFSLGVGDHEFRSTIYSEKNNPESQLASLVPGIMTDLHQHADANIIEFDIDIVSLDSFCNSKGIQHIHFLKIDTEGYELNVLKGAIKLISRKAIDVVQFEFNEMNIYARVFLKDFYEALPGFDFFRMDEDKLVYLGPHNAILEVFRYQNFVAIRKELTPRHLYATLIDKAVLYSNSEAN